MWSIRLLRSNLSLYRPAWRAALALACAAVLVLAPTGAAANEAAPWTVTEVAGAVSLERDGAPTAALAAGQTLAPGARIRTAADGRAALARNGDIVEVAADSALELPGDAAGRPVKGVVQTLGTLLFKIVTRPEDPFRVQTPYLAALVKGTVFAVTVQANGTTLRVDRGAVEVTSKLSRETSLIRAGQTAVASSRSGVGLKVTGVPAAGSSDAAPANAPAQPQLAAAEALPADLAAVVKLAATHPDLAVARAQIEALIADNAALAHEIALRAARERPDLALAAARAAALARPDRASDIFAAIEAAAPGRGVAEAARGFDQARIAPMNAGRGPEGTPPQTSNAAAGRPTIAKPEPNPVPCAVAGVPGCNSAANANAANTLPGPSLSGP
jgi:hypothetical protein